MKAKIHKASVNIVIVILVFAFTASVGLCVWGILANSERYIKFYPDCQYQTVEGFGASSAWIYQALGLVEDENFKNEAIDMLYGSGGLKLTEFRYGIGAGGTESDAYGDPLRGADSFFIADRFKGDYSVFKDISNYDFSRDRAVIDMFERALATGNVKRVVIFTASPHYLMTVSGKTHGEFDNQNNLKEECYEAFSDYLLVITDYLYKNIICKYNPDIKVSISPLNEPQWSWGGPWASQEGCHYDPIPLARFCDTFYKTVTAFNDKHATHYEVDIFESACCKLDFAKDYIDELSKYDWFYKLNTVSLHSYVTELDIKARKEFYKYIPKNLNVYVSEYCIMEHGVDPSIDKGLYSAKIMLRDLAYLHAIAWNYWLSISCGDYEDGLVYWNKDEQDNDILRVSKRYYTFGQVSRFAVGSTMIKTKYFTGAIDGIEQVAFIREDGSIVLIVINDGKDDVRIKLKGISGYIHHILTDANNDWTETTYTNTSYINVGAKSINTYILTSK